jgi:hypothetical protein
MGWMIQGLNSGRNKRFFFSKCIDWQLGSMHTVVQCVSGVTTSGLNGQGVRLTTCIPVSAEDKKYGKLYLCCPCLPLWPVQRKVSL